MKISLRKKIVASIFGVALLAATIYLVQQRTNISVQQPALVHWELANKELETGHKCSQFAQRKNAIKQFYTSGAYEKEVERIVKHVEPYFLSIPVYPYSLIIFDVDDTSLYHYHVSFEFKFIWENIAKLASTRKPGDAPAIKPVLELYKKLVDKGYKIVFLTGRSEQERDYTVQELKKNGYTTYDNLYLMPDKLAYDPKHSVGEWKLSVRKDLLKKYDIVGHIGDRERDFFGGYNGYRVKLPNYLY